MVIPPQGAWPMAVMLALCNNIYIEQHIQWLRHFCTAVLSLVAFLVHACFDRHADPR